MLGSDYDCYFDDNDNLLVEKPSSWATLNNDYACYIATEEYTNPDNENEWYQYGVILATVNGVDSAILIYYSNEYPTGQIQGYAHIDYDDMSTVPDFYQFQDDDEIDLVYPIISDSGENIYKRNENPFKFSEAVLDYVEIDLSGYSVMVWYDITDVYGNTYETEGDIVQ